MNWKRIGLIALIGGVSFGTVACTDGYGYGGASLGYGSGYYADPYYADGGYGGYGGYGDGYGDGYGYGGYGGAFGWSNNFYYPGAGVYVYDQNRRRYRWNDAQRRYWQGRPGWRQNGRANWNGFQRPDRGDLRGNRPGYRNGAIDRGQFQGGPRGGRGDGPRAVRPGGQQDYGGYRRENRGEGVRGPRGGEGMRAPRGDRGVSQPRAPRSLDGGHERPQ